MSIIRPFKGIRPRADLASAIAALPYDVYNSEEAREIVAAEPKSFLQIDRAETLLPKGTNPYSEAVYKTASETLNRMIDGRFFSSGQRTLLLLIRAYNERKNTDRACRLRFDRRLLQQCDLKTRKYTGSKRAGQNPSHRRMQRPDRTDLSRLPRRQKTRRDHQKRPINT